MKIEDQVCSLEYAKKLKELGANQNSLFQWEMFSIDKAKLCIPSVVCKSEEFRIKDFIYYSAFTVAELGEMFPEYIEIRKNVAVYLRIDLMPSDRDWRVQYMRKTDELKFITDRIPVNPICEQSEADARAKMLIHLIEKGIINANQ